MLLIIRSVSLKGRLMVCLCVFLKVMRSWLRLLCGRRRSRMLRCGRRCVIVSLLLMILLLVRCVMIMIGLFCIVVFRILILLFSRVSMLLMLVMLLMVWL